MSKIAYINGRLIQNHTKETEITNILVQDEQILGLGYLPDEKESDITVIDIKGKYIIPNIIDSFASTHQGGETHRGMENCLKNGGISHAMIHHGKHQALDQPEMLDCFKNTNRLFPIGLTQQRDDLLGLSEMALIKAAGAVALLCENPFENLQAFKNVLQYSTVISIPIIVTPNHPQLRGPGQMHGGKVSHTIGVKGIPRSAENVAVAAIIEMVRNYGGQVHLTPITTAESVAQIKQAKDAGLAITAATAPQYLYFTDTDINNYDTNKKVLPPLREKSDCDALLNGLQTGVIDIIASHHNPCSIDEKRTDFVSASFGMSIIDIFLPLVLHKLHHEHNISLQKIAELISDNPKKIFKLPVDPLSPGKKANFTIIDTQKTQTVTEDLILSSGKNNPFLNKELTGWPV